MRKSGNPFFRRNYYFTALNFVQITAVKAKIHKSACPSTCNGLISPLWSISYEPLQWVFLASHATDIASWTRTKSNAGLHYLCVISICNVPSSFAWRVQNWLEIMTFAMCVLAQSENVFVFITKPRFPGQIKVQPGKRAPQQCCSCRRSRARWRWTRSQWCRPGSGRQRCSSVSGFRLEDHSKCSRTRGRGWDRPSQYFYNNGPNCCRDVWVPDLDPDRTRIGPGSDPDRTRFWLIPLRSGCDPYNEL